MGFKKDHYPRIKTTKSSVEKISELEFKNIKNLDHDKIKFFIEKIFDVEEVAQDFYRKISNWFFWALNPKCCVTK